jgi:mono/diheme cytochrome c family protein
MTMKTATHRTLLLALAGAALCAVGCQGDRDGDPPRQFFPDMDDQPKWKPQEKSGFFADGRTMRPPVAGTVPFGRASSIPGEETPAVAFQAERARFVQDNPVFLHGMDGKTFVNTIPIEVTDDLMKVGQTKFNIYCAVCHGYTGDGKGLVGLKFTIAPANFHDPKYKVPDPNSPDPLSADGYIYSVIRNGVRSMPSYAHALSEEESWAVVAYLRALQASQEGTFEQVPEAQRPRVQKDFDLMPDPVSASPATPAPATPAPTTPANGGTQ